MSLDSSSSTASALQRGATSASRLIPSGPILPFLTHTRASAAHCTSAAGSKGSRTCAAAPGSSGAASAQLTSSEAAGHPVPSNSTTYTDGAVAARNHSSSRMSNRLKPLQSRSAFPSAWSDAVWTHSPRSSSSVRLDCTGMAATSPG
eukprot:2569360-Rhodomonas_salina.4